MFDTHTSTGTVFAISTEGWFFFSMFDHYFFDKENNEMKRLSEDRQVKLLTLLGRCLFWVSIRTPTACLISSSFFYVLPGEMQGNSLDFVTTDSLYTFMICDSPPFDAI